jgi:hypothetical protein
VSPVRRARRHLLALVALAVVACALVPAAPVGAAVRSSCVRWVSPKGSDRWSGSSAKPWATLRHAARAVPDDRCTVWFRDGVYKGYNHVERRFKTWTTFRAVHPYEAVFVSSSIALEIGPSASHIVVQGLQFHQTGPSATGDLVYVSGADSGTPAPSDIVLRDNVIHDAWGDDLLKIRSAAHDITVAGNVFYDQSNGEQHIDVNGVTDVTIVGNIFFNDFGGSGRSDTRTTKHFIVVKDSNGKADGFLGSRRIWIERNVFLRWQGGKEALIGVGNDGMPYLEARKVHVVNNLMIGNGTDEAWTALAVLGAAGVSFVNNTVVGNLPSGDYAMDVGIKDQNPRNRGVAFVNNVWDDPTGTMSTFSGGTRSQTSGLLLKRNLYWNGGRKIPGGDLLSPLRDDAQRVVRDPRLRKDQRAIVLPYWKGTRFRSGNRTIHQEFLRLVRRFGSIPIGSPAVGKALMTFAPKRDILGRLRGATADLGAYEAHG